MEGAGPWCTYLAFVERDQSIKQSANQTRRVALYTPDDSVPFYPQAAAATWEGVVEAMEKARHPLEYAWGVRRVMLCVCDGIYYVYTLQFSI